MKDRLENCQKTDQIPSKTESIETVIVHCANMRQLFPSGPNAVEGGHYATRKIAKGSVVFTEDNAPDAQLPREKRPNCEVGELPNGKMEGIVESLWGYHVLVLQTCLATRSQIGIINECPMHMDQ